MLSPLQERVVALVADLPEAKGFALAGGAALIVLGVVDRPTRDLDFFSRESENVNRLLPTLEAALEVADLRVSRKRVEPGFARISVSDESEETTVDLSGDFRLLPPVRTHLGPVLSEEELAADKTLALFSRAEERDFVDVYHLTRRLGFDRLCELAAAKDPGFSRVHLAEMLGRFDRFAREGFEVDDETFAALAKWVSSLRAELAPTRRHQPPDVGL